MKLSTFYDEPNDSIRVGRVVGALLLLLVFCWALAVAVWGLSVATAGLAGKGNVHKIIQSPNNRIFQYQHFFDINAAIQTDSLSLYNAERQALAHRTDTKGQPDPIGVNATEQARLDSIVTGLANHCLGLVNQYNADSREYTRAQFRSSQLPESISTDVCKENNQ